MKNAIFTVMILLLAGSVFADGIKIKEAPENREHKILKEQVTIGQNNALFKLQDDFPGGVIWYEDFEPGGDWHRWTGEDLTNPHPVPNKWHLTTWNALEDSSWWMADTSFGNNGGYDNEWYQVLDTRPIVIDDTTASLRFYHRYSVESPAGASDGYDGWDGMNIRISNDGGENWQVIPMDTYGATSLYSFGFQHKEGIGIPGWAGTQDNWSEEMVTLDDFFNSGDSVMIRFAFASDPAWSTADGSGPNAYGWLLDSIEVIGHDSLLFANYGNAEGMSGKSVAFVPPPGGDLWHVAEVIDTISALRPSFKPGDPNAAIVQRGEGFSMDSTYNPYMDNVYTTGPIALPDTTPLYLDFKFIPYFADGDEFPEREFWTAEVKPVDGSQEWMPVYFDNGSSEPGRYVFAFSEDRWMRFSSVMGALSNESVLHLTEFRGEDVYLRIRFYSDEDLPLGPGLFIDDMVVYAPINPPATPQNVSVTPGNEDSTVTVNWDWQEGINYEIWRTTPGDQFIHLIGETTDSTFVDTAVTPFQVYYYGIRASVQYEGSSDWSQFYGTFVIPSVLKEVGYDDAETDGYYDYGYYTKMVVKFTPEYYPVEFDAFKIHLDSTKIRGRDPAGKGRFYAFMEDSVGNPGEQVAFKQVDADLQYGFNIVQFESKVEVDSGSFFIGYERFRNSRYISIDSTLENAGYTYWETDSGWAQSDSFAAMIRVYMDTSKAKITNIEAPADIIANDFLLGENYPNPFNPVTHIPFYVPASAANQHAELAVYNILGQRVATLFSGQVKTGMNIMRWNGRNDAGKSVGSGIYIYQLKSGETVLNRRMLLIK